MSCCGSNQTKSPETSPPSCCDPKPKKWDSLLWITSLVIISALLWNFFQSSSSSKIDLLALSVSHSLSQMWIGMLMGIFFVALLEHLPDGVVPQILGTHQGYRGILRAILAGVVLDLCNHGILLIALGLYRKGASLGQVFAFLIASPWNSISLTLILISMIGLSWTLLFIAASAFIGFISGCFIEKMVQKEMIPKNPYQNNLSPSSPLKGIQILKSFHLSPQGWLKIIFQGVKASKMLFRWLFLGIIITALIQVFVPTSWYQSWFGPHLIGLILTLLAATLIEVCSEGSVPIASDLFTRAQAPGNAFAFLMAGASTDYTEVMALQEVTGSWKLALLLPLITIPQILIISWLMNLR